MKLHHAVLSSVLALGVIGFAGTAMSASGKVEAVSGEGRVVTVAGQEYKISGSRTQVMIGGGPGSRDQIKVGMTCDVTAPGEEATVISCK